MESLERNFLKRCDDQLLLTELFFFCEYLELEMKKLTFEDSFIVHRNQSKKSYYENQTN
jgi:hypothetical protein